ncbi:MAG: beta-ketoacyl synthase [Cyclobacteriaceae bacterium]|nr:beta-ketoacyl synthase [Cyclobacteriaceae bacterium]
MRQVYTIADFIISSLGVGTPANMAQLRAGKSGIREIEFPQIPLQPVYASRIDDQEWLSRFSHDEQSYYTRLELQFILAIKSLLQPVDLMDLSRFLLVISTTKGNIDLMEQSPEKALDQRALLPVMARRINTYFSFPHEAVVISNACISGVSAMLAGQMMISAGHYDHVLVLGGDLFSHFVYSGFNSFMALSKSQCKPFDKNRDGINLGEAVAGVFLSSNPGMCQNTSALAKIVGGGQSNDANHISGPSREGLGLKIAVAKAMKQAGLTAANIDYINAHGTATVYNDEMEAKAFAALGLGEAPLNSLKGYYGHTLGAAGILESVIAIWQLNEGDFLKSAGYEESGTSEPLNVLKNRQQNNEARFALKTASGFGGGNAAIIFEKP